MDRLNDPSQISKSGTEEDLSYEIQYESFDDIVDFIEEPSTKSKSDRKQEEEEKEQEKSRKNKHKDLKDRDTDDLFHIPSYESSKNDKIKFNGLEYK